MGEDSRKVHPWSTTWRLFHWRISSPQQLLAALDLWEEACESCKFQSFLSLVGFIGFLSCKNLCPFLERMFQFQGKSCMTSPNIQRDSN